MPRSNLEMPRWPDSDSFAPADIHPDGLLGGFAWVGNVPVSAPAKHNAVVDITKYPHRPEQAVQGNTGMDDWVRGRFSRLYMSKMGPANEKAFGQGADGGYLIGTSVDDSKAFCPPNGVLCAHSHPLQSEVGWKPDSKTVQPWRLGFGEEDYQALMHGMPNYMMNYQRRLQVLEYTPSGGYTVRDLGDVPYLGPDR